jgi:ceramide glucosyltransferase
MSLDLASAALLLWASMSVGPALVARARRVARLREAAPRATTTLERVEVHLIRPCAGDEPELERSLSGLPALEGASLTVSFCVASLDDAAVPAIESARRALGARGITTQLVQSRAIGPNRKVQQVLAALPRDASAFDDGRLVVVADSDVDLEGFPLVELIAPLLEDRRVGAVWAPPHEAGRASTTGDRASSALLGASMHAFALLSELDPAGLVGKTFAARESTLVRTVRFAELDRYLGEDMELSRRLVDGGAEVRVTATGVRSLASGRSFSRMVERFARWLAVIKAQRPALLASYPLMFFPLSSIALVALVLATPLACIAVLVAFLGRLWTASVARRFSSGPAPLGALVRDVVLGEAVLVASFVRAVTTRRFAWREQWMRLGRDGRLLAAE